MAKQIPIRSKEDVKNGIIALGQELIRRAEDISNDIEHVTAITVYARLDPAEVVNLDVTKNYIAVLEETKEEIEKFEPKFFNENIVHKVYNDALKRKETEK